MTLDNAQDQFRERPTKATAGAYLQELMTYESAGMIGDETFLDGLAEIRDWLQQ